jgi:hypothetical protein
VKLGARLDPELRPAPCVDCGAPAIICIEIHEGPLYEYACVPCWTKRQAVEKLGVYAGPQSEPDGRNCALCGDNDHQAFECPHR